MYLQTGAVLVVAQSIFRTGVPSTSQRETRRGGVGLDWLEINFLAGTSACLVGLLT